MDLFINIVLLVVGFIGALTAIGGDTWDKSQKSVLRKLTKRGRVAILCLLVTLALGIVKEARVSAYEDRLQAERKASRDQLREARSQLQEANSKLEKTQQALEDLEPTVLEAMYRLTARIVREDDFATARIRGRRSVRPISSETNGPLELYGGDIVEYHVYCEPTTERLAGLPGILGAERQRPSRASLILAAGNRIYPMRDENGEHRVMAPIGQATPAVIHSEGDDARCDVKLIVSSTDRSRMESQFSDILDRIKLAKTHGADAEGS